MCFFCGLSVSKQIISLGLCGFAKKFRCWDRRQNQIRYKGREIEPWGAESCSMLPRYVLKNGGVHVRVDC